MIDELMNMSGDLFGRARSTDAEEADPDDTQDQKSVIDIIRKTLTDAGEDDNISINVEIHEGHGHVSVTQDFCDLLVNADSEEEEKTEEEDPNQEEEFDINADDEGDNEEQ